MILGILHCSLIFRKIGALHFIILTEDEWNDRILSARGCTGQNNFIDTPHSFLQHISSLIRCYSCQSFGHYANSCKNQSYCARQNCTKNCYRPPHCINWIRTSNKLWLKLNFHHPEFSKSCPTYKLIASESLVQNAENAKN